MNIFPQSSIYDDEAEESGKGKLDNGYQGIEIKIIRTMTPKP